MNENFLHHLWKLKLFNFQNLQTTTGELIEVIKPGEHNHDAGPDFFNARIRIGNTLWAGNVEIHIKSSDWKNHAHEQDDAYDNVILHVVYEEDELVRRKDRAIIPTLELKGKFDERLWKNYNELIQSRQWIPCGPRVSEVDEFTFSNWIDRLLTERLERKTEVLFSSLESTNNNWEETFYHHLTKNFGFKINGIPFETLARSLPLVALSKHKDRLIQLEAMLFGQAGMLLEKFTDDYPAGLLNEYLFLKNKFRMEPIAGHSWKFLRLRPVNFPTIRIAQFAQLVHRSSHLFSKVLDCNNIDVLRKYFDVEVSQYWKTHFLFDKLSPESPKRLGEDAFQNILVNTIVPFLFAFGKGRGSDIHLERALEFLEQAPPENNSVIDNWAKLGIRVTSAYRSQALLQLKNEYCEQKNCLACSVGNYLIKKNS